MSADTRSAIAQAIIGGAWPPDKPVTPEDFPDLPPEQALTEIDGLVALGLVDRQCMPVQPGTRREVDLRDGVEPTISIPERFGGGIDQWRGRWPALDDAMKRLELQGHDQDQLLAAASKDAARERDLEQRAMRWDRYVAARPASMATASYKILDRTMFAAPRRKRRPDDPETSYPPMARQDPDSRVSKWWTSPHKTLVLVGPSQHGKTTAAWAVCNDVAEMDRDAAPGTPPVRVVAWSAAQLYDQLGPLEAHQRRDEALASWRERTEKRIISADLVFLDDLGREPGGTGFGVEDWRALLFRILDARDTTPGRRTIVTINSTDRAVFMEELVARYGEPLALRLIKGGVAAWIEGPSPFAGLVKWADPFE